MNRNITKELFRIICIIVVFTMLTSCNSQKINSSSDQISGSPEIIDDNQSSSHSQVTESTVSNESHDTSSINTNVSTGSSIKATVSNDKTVDSQKEDKINLDNINIKDNYGDLSINVMGDSISHGANAKDIPNQSYVGILKRSLIRAKSGAGNYGFTSLWYEISNPKGIYTEIHEVSKDKSWTIYSDGDVLGANAFIGTVKDSIIKVQPKRGYKFFSIFYASTPGGGDFDILINDKYIKTISTNGKLNKCARTELIPNVDSQANTIKIVHKGNGSVMISGIGYYDNNYGIVVNNYSRSGLKLTDLSDDVIKHICKSSVVVFSLGYNDMAFDYRTEFSKKIDLIISEINKNKSKLIVNNFLWGNPGQSTEHANAEINRLAVSCNAIYNSYDMNNCLSDGTHPNLDGHIKIARKLCENLGIKCIK